MGTQDVIREHVMVGLHVARLAPGDPVPSVRRMAQLTGLDRKAIHRAYLRLAAEGLLVTRPGSGTYVAPAGPEGTPDAAQLLSASERFADEAGALVGQDLEGGPALAMGRHISIVSWLADADVHLVGIVPDVLQDNVKHCIR